MSEKRIGLAHVADDRFAIMLLDPVTTRMQGPDAGEDHAGYTPDELPSVLSERYGMAAADIGTMIREAIANAEGK